MEIWLDQARRRAKELPRAAREGNADAPARLRPRRDRLLLAHGADPLVRDEDGLTPYDIAARRPDDSLVALIEARL
jgi:ankyrin repeat protein